MKVYDMNIKLIYCTYTRKKLCLNKFMTRLWEKTQFFFLFLETRCELHFLFYKLFSNSIHCEYFSNNSNNWKKHMFYMLPTTLHIFFIVTDIITVIAYIAITKKIQNALNCVPSCSEILFLDYITNEEEWQKIRLLNPVWPELFLP